MDDDWSPRDQKLLNVKRGVLVHDFTSKPPLPLIQYLDAAELSSDFYRDAFQILQDVESPPFGKGSVQKYFEFCMIDSGNHAGPSSNIDLYSASNYLSYGKDKISRLRAEAIVLHSVSDDKEEVLSRYRMNIGNALVQSHIKYELPIPKTLKGSFDMQGINEISELTTVYLVNLVISNNENHREYQTHVQEKVRPEFAKRKADVNLQHAQNSANDARASLQQDMREQLKRLCSEYTPQSLMEKILGLQSGKFPI